MSYATAHLALPFIMAAQAQKHVTHNEALRILDGLVQLSVLDRDLAAPPASPADGDRYIVGSGATGDWAGWDLNVALWTDGAWLRLPPRTGWRAWVEDEGLLLVYDGTELRCTGRLITGSPFPTQPVEKPNISVSAIALGNGTVTVLGNGGGENRNRHLDNYSLTDCSYLNSQELPRRYSAMALSGDIVVLEYHDPAPRIVGLRARPGITN